MVGMVPPAFVKPRLRGVSHQYAFFLAAALGAGLVLLAEGARARVGATVYAIGVCGLFGISALYHRRCWSPAAARWMRRADHSMIFCFIAASYTPFALLVLHGTLAIVLLAVVWGGALAGIVMKFVWLDAPDWLGALLYVLLGWTAVAAAPALYGALGPLRIGLLALGGLLYTAGAVVYARQRPDWDPAVFGYHELFHVLVIAAAGVHFTVIAGVVA
ncbi:MAG: PAQR family membrane homeostasis protein TrhA [Solirubrobacteraceae bacterium]